MLEKYGADALRLYVMFVAPPEKEIEWSDEGIEGSFRFLVRVWRLVDHWAALVGESRTGGTVTEFTELTEGERAVRRKTHDTIRRVTVDIEERMHLNTAVSRSWSLVNELYAFSDDATWAALKNALPRPAAAPAPDSRWWAKHWTLVLMVSPLLRTWRELWQMLGHDGGRAGHMAVYDADVAKAQEVVVPVQINAVRARVTVPAELPDAELVDLCWRMPSCGVTSWKTIRRSWSRKGRSCLSSYESCRDENSPENSQRPLRPHRWRRHLRLYTRRRGSALPASIDDRHPMFTNRTSVSTLRRLTTKVRGRASDGARRDRAGLGSQLPNGEVTAVSIVPSAFNAAQLASGTPSP
jgi:leucyl-tRNA synthetase